MFPKKPKSPTVEQSDPMLASQLKLDLCRLMRDREWLETRIAKINADIKEIEAAFGNEDARSLMTRFGYAL
jgi:hypothetical protein